MHFLSFLCCSASTTPLIIVLDPSTKRILPTTSRVRYAFPFIHLYLFPSDRVLLWFRLWTLWKEWRTHCVLPSTMIGDVHKEFDSFPVVMDCYQTSYESLYLLQSACNGQYPCTVGMSSINGCKRLWVSDLYVLWLSGKWISYIQYYRRGEGGIFYMGR